MIKKVFAAAALALAASSAFAAIPTAFYGGLDAGSTELDGANGNKTSVGGFLGYGFNRHLAVELGYRRLGKWSANGDDFTLGQVHVSVIGVIPLSQQFDLYGRLGHNALHGEYSYGNNRDIVGGFYGAGLNYSFTPTVSGRLEFQKPSSDSHNLNVSLVYKF